VSDGEKKQRYPGPRQILRYMRLEQEIRDDGTVWARTPVLDDLLDSGGAMRLGAIAPMCDLAAGAVSSANVAPDLVATLDFKLHLSGLVRSGFVNALCQPLRVGMNTILSESRLTDDQGDDAGAAYVTFTRLARKDNIEKISPMRPGVLRYQSKEEEARLPLDEYLGIRLHPTELSFDLDHHARIYNSFGSIQGGAMAALLERAASLGGERAFGCPARTVDLHFSYTAQARVSPFRVTSEILRTSKDSVLCRVELRDTGLDDRLAAVGTATAVPIRD
jgi:acyl-coenzyme A thioesterase PaaI-like protein